MYRSSRVEARVTASVRVTCREFRLLQGRCRLQEAFDIQISAWCAGLSRMDIWVAASTSKTKVIELTVMYTVHLPCSSFAITSLASCPRVCLCWFTLVEKIQLSSRFPLENVQFFSRWIWKDGRRLIVSWRSGRAWFSWDVRISFFFPLSKSSLSFCI